MEPWWFVALWLIQVVLMQAGAAHRLGQFLFDARSLFLVGMYPFSLRLVGRFTRD